MKISTRLTLGFAVMAVLIVLLGLSCLMKVRDIHHEVSGVIDDSYPRIAALNAISLAIADNARALRDQAASDDPAVQQAARDAIARNGATAVDRFRQLGTGAQDEAARALLATLQETRAAYVKPRDRIAALVADGRRSDALAALYAELAPAQQRYQAALDALVAHEEANFAQARTEVLDAVAGTRLTIAVVVGLALVVATVTGLGIIRSTKRSLGQAVDIARGVAAGNLALPIDDSGRSETAQLLGAMKEMQSRLSGIVGDVRRNADGVLTASSEIAQGNNDLSGRTEQQASALQQTAASMEELSATVRQNADNAVEASRLAQGASRIASDGGSVVAEVVETMREIDASSKKVGEIIGVIDAIAFQTNLLALNAAVVAGEVRALAQRSAGAAREIKALIGASAARVEHGSALADRAGNTMQEVVASIGRVSTLVSGISTASREQSNGVHQVGEAVMQMDQVTQQNAALVEQSAAAAEGLRRQAAQLVQAVAVFELA